MSLTTWKYGEHVGIPTYKVIVSKKSQQYIGPDPELLIFTEITALII